MARPAVLRPALSRRLLADLALLAVAAFWGLTFPLGKLVLASLPPFAYLAVRFAIASTLLAAGGFGRVRGFRAGHWLVGVSVGAVLFAAYALQTVGLRMTTASNAGFITGLSVAMVPVISALWLRRAPRPGVIAGIAAATVGLALLTLQGSAAMSRGDLLVLGCAVAVALHIVLVGRYAQDLDQVGFAASQIVTVMALSAVAAALFERPLPAPASVGPGILWIIAFLALTGTVFAFVTQTWAQKFTSPSHTGLMFTLEPVAAAGAAFVILGEVLSGWQALGAALILAGIVISEVNQGVGAPERPPAAAGLREGADE